MLYIEVNYSLCWNALPVLHISLTLSVPLFPYHPHHTHTSGCPSHRVEETDFPGIVGIKLIFPVRRWNKRQAETDIRHSYHPRTKPIRIEVSTCVWVGLKRCKLLDWFIQSCLHEALRGEPLASFSIWVAELDHQETCRCHLVSGEIRR